MLGVILAIIGFSIALSTLNDEEGNIFDHFLEDKHQKVGLVIFAFAIDQAIAGYLRPHAPEPPASSNESSTDRTRPH
jgi:hypothetical protein